MTAVSSSPVRIPPLFHRKLISPSHICFTIICTWLRVHLSDNYTWYWPQSFHLIVSLLIHHTCFTWYSLRISQQFYGHIHLTSNTNLLSHFSLLVYYKYFLHLILSTEEVIDPIISF